MRRTWAWILLSSVLFPPGAETLVGGEKVRWNTNIECTVVGDPRARKVGTLTLHLSEVKGPVMDRLKRSHFLEELTGKVHLTQFDAVSSINPDLARRTLEAERLP